MLPSVLLPFISILQLYAVLKDAEHTEPVWDCNCSSSASVSPSNTLYGHILRLLSSCAVWVFQENYSLRKTFSSEISYNDYKWKMCSSSLATPPALLPVHLHCSSWPLKSETRYSQPFETLSSERENYWCYRYHRYKSQQYLKSQVSGPATATLAIDNKHVMQGTLFIYSCSWIWHRKLPSLKDHVSL